MGVHRMETFLFHSILSIYSETGVSPRALDARSEPRNPTEAIQTKTS